MKKRKRCIPIYRPHQWHWQSERHEFGTHYLTVKCGRCNKVKTWRQSQ